MSDSKARKLVTHLDDVDNLHVSLNAVDNTHDIDKPISTAVQAALDNKSNIGHTHTIASLGVITIADVQNLASTLANKSDIGHTHNTVASHTHTVSDITDLTNIFGVSFINNLASTELPVVAGTPAVGTSTKAARADHVHPTQPLISHTHAMSDIIGLASALSNKSDISHTHTAANITNFSSAVATEFTNNLAQTTDLPLQDAITAIAGTSTRAARADHVHPINDNVMTLLAEFTATSVIASTNLILPAIADNFDTLQVLISDAQGTVNSTYAIIELFDVDNNKITYRSRTNSGSSSTGNALKLLCGAADGGGFNSAASEQSTITGFFNISNNWVSKGIGGPGSVACFVGSIYAPYTLIPADNDGGNPSEARWVMTNSPLYTANNERVIASTNTVNKKIRKVFFRFSGTSNIEIGTKLKVYGF